MQFLVCCISAREAFNRILYFCQYFLTKIRHQRLCGGVLIHTDGGNPLHALEGEAALEEAVVHVSQVHGTVKDG